MTFEAVTRGIQQTSPLVLQGRNMAMEEIARKQSLQRYDQQQFLQALMGMAGFMRQREKDEAAAGQQTIENERADQQLKMQQNESAAKVAQMAVQNKWTETQIGRVADSMGLEQDMLRAQIAAISGGEERADQQLGLQERQLQMQEKESYARILQMGKDLQLSDMQLMKAAEMQGLDAERMKAETDALRGGERRADEQNVRQGEAHKMSMDRGGVALGMSQAQLDDFLASEGYRRESEELGLDQMRSDLRVSEGTEGYRTDAAKYQAERLRNEADIALFQAEQAQRDDEFRKQLLELPPGSPEAIALMERYDPYVALDLHKMERALTQAQELQLSPAQTKEQVLGLVNEAREKAALKFQEFKAEESRLGAGLLGGEQQMREYTALAKHIKTLDAMAANLQSMDVSKFTGGAQTFFFDQYQNALAPGEPIEQTQNALAPGEPIEQTTTPSYYRGVLRTEAGEPEGS